ncbi:hypothetical protein OHA88_06090 [Streptomyces sp. NBC_00353]|uniref:hypothetical protein n=1 Tax=Streptomyces sp. NBC_00353 TaxID=2975722 RepID=UPI002E274300
MIVFVVFGVASLAKSATPRMKLRTLLSAGLVGEAAGLIVLAAGMEGANLAAFLIGGAPACAGAGVLFKSVIGSVAAAASPAVRVPRWLGCF